ncbi:MAG: hypothetical protein R2822_31000 [Spirosomataceae bacterium]
MTIDNHNNILKGLRLNSDYVDLPDNIINYIKTTFHPNVSIQPIISLDLDENSTLLNYIVSITAHDGSNNNGITLVFDKNSTYKGIFNSTTNNLGKYRRQYWVSSIDNLPENIKGFIKKTK